MKQLFILRGPSGCGKTTLADSMCLAGIADRIVSADDFFYDEEGHYNFDASQLPDAHASCFHRARDYMAEGVVNLIIDNTFTRKEHILPYIELAMRFGYVVTTIEVNRGLSAEELFTRSVHNVPLHTIQRQIRQLHEDS